MEFHERLYKVRKNAGMTQNDLAEKLDVSRQAVSRWEMGTAKPEFENLIAISDIFGVSIDYLLRGIGEPAAAAIKAEPEPEENSGSTNTAYKLWLAAAITFIVLSVFFTIVNNDWNSGIFTALIVVILLAALIGVISFIAYIVKLVLK